jgi:hypothetical protein
MSLDIQKMFQTGEQENSGSAGADYRLAVWRIAVGPSCGRPRFPGIAYRTIITYNNAGPTTQERLAASGVAMDRAATALTCWVRAF